MGEPPVPLPDPLSDAAPPTLLLTPGRRARVGPQGSGGWGNPNSRAGMEGLTEKSILKLSCARNLDKQAWG